MNHIATQVPPTSIIAISDSTLWLIGIIAAWFVLAWISTFVLLRKNDVQMLSFMENGNLVKLLTVAIVVVTAAILAILGVFSGGVVGLYGSIAGFVLGSIGRKGVD